MLHVLRTPTRNSRRCLGTSRPMEAAVEFLGLFQEAHVWNVSILSTDKRAVVYRPSCSRDFLRQNLQTWLSLHNTHFFIRPLLRTSPRTLGNQTRSLCQGRPNRLGGGAGYNCEQGQPKPRDARGKGQSLSSGACR